MTQPPRIRTTTIAIIIIIGHSQLQTARPYQHHRRSGRQRGIPFRGGRIMKCKLGGTEVAWSVQDLKPQLAETHAAHIRSRPNTASVLVCMCK